jgi:2-methylisocitrate lyase-like PEP mutase family enzyme
MNDHPANQLREKLVSGIHPFMGVYDVFSASIAGKHFDSLFVSGFSFAASHYGLPDIGFIAWPDIVAFVQRIRTILPQHHLLVDIDDGYCDPDVACHVVSQLESIGAAGVVLEDQQRPRRCGHFEGKRIMPLDEFLAKLDRVLRTRNQLFVVARTDSSDPEDILKRVKAFENAGADAVLVDGIKDLEFIRQIRKLVSCPILFNQIAGGKSPPCTLKQLAALGVSLAIYSTPCLFAAQSAIEEAMKTLKEKDGLLTPSPSMGSVGVKACTSHLNDNLLRRDER